MVTTTSDPESVTSIQELKDEFPAYAWMLSEPGVADAFQNTDITSSDQFMSALEGSAWWQQNASSAREVAQGKIEDPATLAQVQGQQGAQINDLSKSIGITLSGDQTSALINQSMTLGWNTQQLTDGIVAAAWAGNATLDPNAAGGIQTNTKTITDLANQYLVPIDQGTAQSWGTQISDGEKTGDDFKGLIQTQAAQKYAATPWLADAINSGTSTADALSSYTSDIAKLLNVSTAEVDYQNNPLYSKVLNYTDPSTGQSRVMSYGEMENYVRSTPQYDATPGALQNAAQIGQGILQTFGKVGGSAG